MAKLNEKELREGYIDKLESDKFNCWYFGFGFLLIALFNIFLIFKVEASPWFLLISVIFIIGSYYKFKEIGEIKRRIAENTSEKN